MEVRRETRVRARRSLPSWTDGEVRDELLDFVRAVTTERNADCVRAADRVAAFDNGGTPGSSIRRSLRRTCDATASWSSLRAIPRPQRTSTSTWDGGRSSRSETRTAISRCSRTRKVGEGRRAAFLLHHDDPERAAAYDRDFRLSPLARGLDVAREDGVRLVSMKRDFERVFTWS